MIKLEMTFNNLSELADFVKDAKGVTSAKVSIPPVIAEENAEPTPAQKAAKTKAANKLKKAQEAEAKKAQEALQVVAPMKVEDTAASVMVAPVAAPVVMPAPVVAPVAAPVVAPVIVEPVVEVAAINRPELIEMAGHLIARLKAFGIADEEIIPKLTEVFTSVGVAFGKISALSDIDLPIVIEALTQYIVASEAAGAPVQAAQAYV